MLGGLRSLNGSEGGAVAHYDLRAERHAGVEVDDVAVGQAEAAGRDRLTDRLWLVGAVDAEDRRAEIEGAGPHGIARSSCHEARQIRLRGETLGGWPPVRPLGLAVDPHEPGPLETLAADADTVAQGPVVALDEIDKPFRGVDDECTGRLA